MYKCSISVVIPLFNKGIYIKNTILSVVAQTFQEFEVIVVDDGSTDDGSGIVRNFKDPRIRLIQQENGGVSAARNRGINASRSSLVAFLDADDAWKPNFLETILRLKNKYPEAGAYATGFEIRKPSGITECAIFEAIPSPPWEGIIPNYFKSVLAETPVWTSAVAVPKYIFSTVGYFPEDEPMGEDQDMWCRIALNYPIAFSNTLCSTYLEGAHNSACANNFIRKELPVVTTLRRALESGNFPKSTLSYLREYIAKLQIVYAYSLLSEGKTSEARKVLMNIKTKRFRKQRVRLFIGSYKNTKLVNFYYYTKKVFIKFYFSLKECITHLK